MRRFLVGMFAVIGFLVVLGAAAGVGLALWSRSRAPHIADNTVLALDLTGGFPDSAPSNALSKLIRPGRPPLRDVLDAIEKAREDQRVTGLIVRLGDAEMGLAEAQELRDAITAFRAKGKRAVAYADSFGEMSGGTRSYYLAAACGEIWLQPVGVVGLVGLRAEEPFFRGTLDLLGVVPRFDRREEFKSAADPVTEKTMTGPDRTQITAILDTAFKQIVEAIAADRKLDEATVRGLVDRGPLLAQEALDAHLVDHLGYSDDALAAIGEPADGSRKPMPIARYLAVAGHPHVTGPRIALIYASGQIVRGSAEGNGLTDTGQIGADQLVDAFRQAERDPEVRAILFRINSPGGSAVASETIWRETVRAKAAGKKLIVSMGNVAGSGGYYIAAAADKIVAEPATLTGSIGALGGKLLFNGLIDKLGVSYSAVQVGANAGIDSPVEDFTPAGKQRFEQLLDDIYGVFKTRVGDGRKLDAATVESIAKGRVWIGEDAKAHGLVDALGGYATALDLAKQEAGIAADSDVSIRLFPPQRGLLRTLIARFTGRDSDDASASLGRSLALVQALAARLDPLLSPPGALMMPPIEIR